MVVFLRITLVVGVDKGKFAMSSDSRSRSRSRSPLDRKIRSDRFSYRNAPYRRESRRGFRFLTINLLFIYLC